MSEFPASNDWQWRLLRTIVQGVLGVVIANLDLIMGWCALDPGMRGLVNCAFWARTTLSRRGVRTLCPCKAGTRRAGRRAGTTGCAAERLGPSAKSDRSLFLPAKGEKERPVRPNGTLLPKILISCR